jgi:hypothetical protein
MKDLYQKVEEVFELILEAIGILLTGLFKALIYIE